MKDLRKIKSRELLKDAFWRVLERKKYSEIFIKDVVEEAGINRKTFTAHYESVDGLMRDCVRELIQKVLTHFQSTTEGDSLDFAYATHEYTRFALDNRQQLQLISSNQLDSVALHYWKQYLYTVNAMSLESPLRHDLYFNYSMYCCWGNLMWVLDHADLPLETLVAEALDVYRRFISHALHLYEIPEYGRSYTPR